MGLINLNPKSTTDENTPLLTTPTTDDDDKNITKQPSTTTTSPNGSSSSTTTQPPSEEETKPLPKLQIALLCYCRLVEPIAFFSIFPFINKMIWETGSLREEDVGFYSGLIESLFSLTQMLVMIPWGRAADRLGRKPVLVASLGGVTVATALFGLSTKIWQMIMFRCIAGVFAGTVVTIRSMISEHSTPKTQARAFSWFAFTSNLGIFLGPLIGGLLSEPAKQYPSLFGNVQFFKDFPYALPTFAGGFIGLTAAVISAVFVTETLTPERRASNKASPHALMSTGELIKFPGVMSVVIIYGYTMLLGLAYTAVAPIFWFTSIEHGGLGFSPFQISMFLALGGLSQAAWILFVFPPLHNRIGTGGVLRICGSWWPFNFILCAVSSILLRHHAIPAFWTVAISFNILGAGVSMAFTSVQLALNDIAPSHSTLGTLNALALALVAGIRAIAPASFASLFAAGVKTQIFDGYLAWVVLTILAAFYFVTLRWLPAKAGDKPSNSNAESEE